MNQRLMQIEPGQFREWLRDESRSQGEAASISFPQSQQEVCALVRTLAASRTPITVQGARTGLAGGAVPHGGHVLNLSRLNRCLGLRQDGRTGDFLLQVEPGVLLSQLRKSLETGNFETDQWTEASRQALQQLQQRGTHFFPPDPTETSASIGGMIACNASGARSFFYGPTRNHVQSLQVVLADGSLLSLQRGEQLVQDGHFSVRTADGTTIAGTLPHYPLPPVKNASGYHLQPEMDLLDLFIGSEGTLGIIVEAELRLRPVPGSIWGISAFFPDEPSAIRFVQAVRGEHHPGLPGTTVDRPVAIELFNHRALDLLRSQRASNPGFAQLQPLSPEDHTAVYVEFHASDANRNLQNALGVGALLIACGGDDQRTWVARQAPELEQLHFFRHATPESVNLLIDQRRQNCPGLTKLGTDMAVPDQWLAEVMKLYNRRLAEEGLESVVFGHVGNNHLHVNILPRDMHDYGRAKQLYLEWARQVIRWGGTVSAEHGIGKLKTAFLAEMYGENGLAKMRQVKRTWDPAGLLSPGNMFQLEGQV